MSLEIIIEKKFKNFKLDVDFSTENKSLGILGASGSGKSMTLKCIAGIITPDKGRIVINNKILYDSEKKINLPTQKRKVGYMFQNYALFPHLSVEQNIGFAVSVDKKHKKEMIADLIGRFELKGLENKKPSQLSGGQQQRVALARILAYEPNVIMLDEPFSALDYYLKEKMLIELLDMLKDYNGHILLVTHNRDEVYTICKNLLVIEKGKSISIGDTKEMFKKPIYLSVAKLTGCKNFSKIEILDDYSLKAIDWNFILTTNFPIPKDTTHIGIRANDFIPEEKYTNEKNIFPIKIINTIEGAFENKILFTHKETTHSHNNELWWIYNKKHTQIKSPSYIRINPDSILLLNG